MQTVYLVDASVYVFRAWFSIPEAVVDSDSRPANAVYGFGSFLCDLLEFQSPDYIVCAFDESLTRSFRNDLYPPYKANRPLPPPELQRQFEVCRELTRALGVVALAAERFEADDLIGSAARRLRGDGVRMVFVTADKDYAQLVEPGDYWWDIARDRWLDLEGTTRHIGVRPDQVADYLALAGDSVDNIPGVPGIGNKTATALLTALDNLERVYEELEAVLRLGLRGAARVHRLLCAHREQAFLCRALSRIHCEAPIDETLTELGWQGVHSSRLESLALPVQLRNRCRQLTENPLGSQS